MHVNTLSSLPFKSYWVVDATDEDNFGTYLESFVQISLTSTNRRTAVGHDRSAKHCSIHLDCAKAMVQRTTQRGICSIANPALLQ